MRKEVHVMQFFLLIYQSFMATLAFESINFPLEIDIPLHFFKIQNSNWYINRLIFVLICLDDSKFTEATKQLSNFSV